jgi:uncharacterized protein YgiM (DUF1202 family)
VTNSRFFRGFSGGSDGHIIRRLVAVGAFWGILVSATASAFAADVPFRLQNRNQTIEGVGKLENGHFEAQSQNGGLTFQITGDVRGNDFAIEVDGYFCPTGSLGASRAYATGDTQPATGKISVALSVSCGGYWQNQEKVVIYFDLPQANASGGGAVAPAAATVPSAGTVAAPFTFQANNLVYEGVAKIENGRLTGDASANGGNVHLEGDIKGGKLSVQATGNFAPGLGMGSNLLANGSISPAVGKVTFGMFTSAGRDYAASLRCRLNLDLSGGSAPASATAEIQPTPPASAPAPTTVPATAPAPAATSATTASPTAAAPTVAALPPMDLIDGTYIATNPARVREKPNASSKRIKTINAGQKITVVGKLKGQNWYLVSENDKPIGYIVASDLVPESQYHPPVASTVASSAAPQPAPAAAAPAPAATLPPMDVIDETYIAVNPAKVREKPDAFSKRIKTIEAGQKITVAGKLKGQDWYLVSENDKPLGYVAIDQLVPESKYHAAAATGASPAPATTAPQPVAAAAVPAPAAAVPAPAAGLPPMDIIDQTYVAVNPAKVREKPDPFSKRIKTIDAGQPVNVAGRLKGQDWYLVSENDQPLGYVAVDQLVPESQYRSAAAPAAPAAPAAAVASAQPAPAPAPPPAIPPALANIDFGQYVALVIGNDNYANGLPSLKTAGDDAWAVAETLKNDYGFRVTVIVDATRSQIIGALARLRETLTWDDNLLIYYAGHGSYDQGSDQGYWLPVDAVPDDPTNWVSNTDITNMLKAIQARHVMVVADSCYSGTLTRDANVAIKDSDYIQRMVQKKARTVMTSGGLEPVADSGGSGHSVFAAAFIAALQQNNGVMDAQSFFAKVREPVVLAAPQTPEYSNLRFAGHEGGDFVFVRKQ